MRCQSMTLHTELHASPNISEALPHTLTHCIVDSTDGATPYCPLHPCPHMCHPLFVCLLPLLVVSVIDRQWADAKSDCAHCIRRGLSRRLRSSLLLNLSPTSGNTGCNLIEL